MPHQCRIACLRIPGFQIAAHQKADPSLKGKTLVIVSGSGGRARLVACSARASASRLWPGMKLSEARAVVADLVWRQYDESLYEQTQEELTAQLLLCSPKISIVEPGLILIDASGMAHLGGEDQLCKNLNKTANKLGFLDSHVGVADSAFCSLVASRYKNRRFFIVPSGQDKDFLAGLPIKHLPQSDLHETLLRLGIRTMGQFAALPAGEIHERFGTQGQIAYELVQGNDYVAPVQVPEKKTFSTTAELGFPVEAMDQCRFILKSLLEELTSRLKAEDLCADSILVEFFNENDPLDERLLKLMQPSNNPKFLLELIRLSLESKPLAREFTRVCISVPQFLPQSWTQHSLRSVSSRQSEQDVAFESCPDEPNQRSDAEKQDAYQTQISIAQKETETCLVAETISQTGESLILLLQRLLGKLGGRSVVKSQPADQHIPDNRGSWLPVAEHEQNRQDLVLPVSLESMNEPGNEALACGLVLKKSPSPEPVLVEYDGELPRSITYRGRWYRIKEMSEPEKLSGLWWENPVQKSYFITLIEPCDEAPAPKQLRSRSVPAIAPRTQMSYLVLLVCDHNLNSWQIEGFFD